MTPEYNGYLAHYGVQGQKWGVRNWQNEDGSYTEEGKHHYGWGYGKQNTASIRRQTAQKPRTASPYKPTDPASERETERRIQEEAVRKEKARKILAIAGGITVAAALVYGGHKLGQLLGKRQYAVKQAYRANRINDYFQREQAKANGTWDKASERLYWKDRKKTSRSAVKYYATGRW